MKIFIFCQQDPRMDDSQFTQNPVYPNAEVYGIIADGVLPVKSKWQKFTACSIDYDTNQNLEVGVVVRYIDGMLFPLITEIAGQKLIPIETQEVLTLEIERGNSNLTVLDAKKWSTLNFDTTKIDLYTS